MDHSSVPGCFDALRSLFSGSRPRSAIRVDNSTAPQIRSKISHVAQDSSMAGLAPGPVVPVPCCPYANPKEFDGHHQNDAWALNFSEDLGPPPYGPPSEEAIYRPEVLNTIEKALASLGGELRELSLKIHDYPETAWNEVYAHDTLTEFMRSHGFKVTPHLAGIKSAWRAEWSYNNDGSRSGSGSGKGVIGRTLGINAEMDALPGIGHACGHNLIAMSGVGVALGVKAALEAHQIPGKIVLLGTPAEEGGGGKILLLEKGAYEGMDVCVMSHPTSGSKGSVSCGGSLATQPLTVEYFGHTAHAALAPWEGQNALDAAVLAYSAVSMLRQQIKPSCRVHGIILGRDWAANIIPDYAKMQWIVRAPTYPELRELVQRVRACIEAAGAAACCRIEVTEGLEYYEQRQNPVLGQEFLATVKERYAMHPLTSGGDTGASTDFGNVTHELPAIQPAYAIPTAPNGGNHTPEFAHASRTPEAHRAAISITKGLALVGVRVLDDDAFYQKAREAFNDTAAKCDTGA